MFRASDKQKNHSIRTIEQFNKKKFIVSHKCCQNLIHYTLYCLNSTQASKALLSLALINDMK
jgi:hypothetical protein